MSDTPRTDAAAALVQYAVVGEQYEVVTAAFAQELERELTHALSEQERMRVGWVATQKELFEARLAAPVPEVDARQALRNLMKESAAVLALCEPQLRDEIGNTNVAVFMQRITEAAAVLASMNNSTSTKGE